MVKQEGYVFIPGKEEVMSGRLRVRYNSTRNEYYVGALENTSQQKIFSGGWDSFVYSCQGIHRLVNETTRESYLERKTANQNGDISWKFDFTTSGLVLERLNIKMDLDEEGGGTVAVCISGDSDIKGEPYASAGSYTTINSLQGSNTLLITANLKGEDFNQVTRIMKQSLTDNECPFDLQIRLKRPDFTIGRSLIFLGLMFSNEQELQKAKHKKVKKQLHDEGGALHIHVQNAKRLPCRRNGTYADPKVKCNLHSSVFSRTVKTKPLNKTLNPIWNEYLTITGLSHDSLHVSHLELQVLHSKRSLARPKEILGYVKLQMAQSINTVIEEEGTGSESVKLNNNNFKIEYLTPSQLSNPSVSNVSLPNRTLSDATFKERISSGNLDNIVEKTINRMINQDTLTTTTNDDEVAKRSYDHIDHRRQTKHENLISKQQSGKLKTNDGHSKGKAEYCENNNDKVCSQTGHDNETMEQCSTDSDAENISFRDNYYQDILNGTMCSNDVMNTSATDDDDTFEIIPSFDTLTHDKAEYHVSKTTSNKAEPAAGIDMKVFQKSPKRRARTISVDNSVLYSGENYTLRALKVSKTSTAKSNQSNEDIRSKSMSNVTEYTEAHKNVRKHKVSLKPFRSGNVSNILEDSYFERKANTLTHKHWSVVLNNPEEWFYCWHPLQGVEKVITG